MPVVALKGVSKGFGGRRILDGVDLALEPGRITVVVGPSGGGKSVLLELIAGFLTPDAGEIEAPEGVSMVFQDGALFDDLTVADNLGFSLRHAPEEARARVEAAAAAVDLSAGHLAARPAQLSGGLRKRAAIARALVQRPQVLLYDEPTAGLDGGAAARVAEAILEARRAQPEQAALVVTHDYPLAARVADEILYLDPATHALSPLLDEAALAAMGPRAEALNPIRDRLEAHFLEAAPLPSEPGGARPPLTARLKAPLAAWRRDLSGLRRLRPPPASTLLTRLWEIGVTSGPSILASGFVLGLVTALQSGQALNATLGDLDALPAMLGVILAHHIGPLYTGLFLAGRVGARVASEVGVKTYLRQADALRTLGASPEGVWLSPMLLAALIAFPLLALALEVAGILGGFMGYVTLLGQNTAGFWHTVLEDVRVGPTLLGLCRAMICGGVVIFLAFRAGLSARRGSDAVGRATTRAVVSGLLGAIAVELIFGLALAG